MAYSVLANKSKTLEVLRAHKLYTKYRLGQNFLINDKIIGKILELSDLRSDDLLLEIGPGIGTLSLALLENACALCSIEHDKDLLPVLADTLSDYHSSFCLINKDALQVDVADIEEAFDTLSMHLALPNKLISNLPYQIAATAMLQYFQEFEFLDEMTVMVQSEVADRISASISTKAYGAYTAKLSLYADVLGRFQVGAQNFFPAPRVESAVIRLKRKKSETSDLTKEEKLRVCGVIDAAFLQRRKTIRNSMSQAYPKDILDEAFERADINPSVRAETLDCNAFIRLTRQLDALQCL